MSPHPHQHQLHQRKYVNGTNEQICLAALIANLDPKKQQENVESSTHIFKKPQGELFLKVIELHLHFCSVIFLNENRM